MKTLLGLLAIAGSLALPAKAAELAVDGTSFVLRQDGRVLKSSELVGAEIDLGDGHVLRIDSVRADPSDPEILLHKFSVRDLLGVWNNPCGVDAEGNQEGFPLPGRWDGQGQFHLSNEHLAFTCTGGAQGKCVRFGYKPWANSKDGQSLLPLYESCVRMVRADYCGNGQPSTSTGMLIDIYDDHGVMHPEPGDGLRFEAGWSPKGAVCVNHTRVPENLSMEALKNACPRLALHLGASCSEGIARKAGAVLFNRSR